MGLIMSNNKTKSKSGCCSSTSHGHSHAHSHEKSKDNAKKNGPCCSGCGYEEYFEKGKNNPVLEPRMAALFAEEGLQNNDLVRPYTLMKYRIKNSEPVDKSYLMGWQRVSTYKEPTSINSDLEILYRQSS